ncbi:MAG: DNA/RNA non-specific endonuclease [Muribaculum sp.]|nr:DNA/RNA non-specific endonuclease [Muribaculum sp.]
MKKLIIGIIISILIACIIYFGCKLADAQSASGSVDSHISLRGIENVIIPSGSPSIVKAYEGFRADFNPERHTPNCVSWILHRDETDGTSQRSNKFWTDPEVKGCPDTRDYTKSGYDRGHLCPAGEQKWSPEAMRHSFVMTNICPQKHDLNSGAWKTLEDKERLWANRDSILVIAAGPIYNSPNPERIGDTGVAVPDAFFKVILAPFASPIRSIGFVYPNMKCSGNMENYATTVDEIEKITGYDFFSTLPDNIESQVESVASFKEWNHR